jgi:tetratricopeptide (TPR) repeat protein
MGEGGPFRYNCPKCDSPLRFLGSEDAWYCGVCRECKDIETGERQVDEHGSRIPSVVSRSSTTVGDRCHICLGAIDEEWNYYECQCGNKSHLSCAEQLDQCSACGEDHKTGEFINSREFSTLMARGRRAYDKKVFDEALHWYDKALKVKRNSARAWNNKGTILARQGRFDMALECYNRALELEKSPLTSYNKAVILLNLKKPQETLGTITEALESKTDDGWFWYIKGCTLLRLDRSEEALECFDRALSLIKGDPLTWVGKGAALVNLKKMDEALECYEQALELDPGNSDILYSTGRILRAEGRIQEAISVFDEVLRKNPRHERAKRDRQRAISKSNE